MRSCSRNVSFAFAMVCSGLLPACGQTKPPSAVPVAAAPVAGTPDPAHDLSGVWMQDLGRPATVKERYWIYELTQDEPPMTEWGKSKFKAAKSSFGEHPYPLAETNDPIYHSCAPPGLPRIYLHPFPLQIVQAPGEVIVLFEYDSMRHQIFTDGRAHDAALGPQWMGDAIGRWEGDVLVVDTVNFNDKTWLDRMGHPHSDALHIVERFKRVSHEHLVDDITIEDSKAYTKPWTAHLDFQLKPWTLGEQFCEDEESFQNFDKSATPEK